MTDGNENVIGIHDNRIVFVVFGSESTFIVENGQTFLKFYADDFAVLNNYTFRSVSLVYDDIFALRLLDFFIECGHFGSLFERIHVYGCRAVSDRRSCHVDCNVASADDNDVSVKLFRFFECDAF